MSTKQVKAKASRKKSDDEFYRMLSKWIEAEYAKAIVEPRKKKEKGIYRLPSKWVKTKLMLKDPALRPHIPLTKLLKRDSLLSMLKTYGMVYVKPIMGSLGRGVMRVELHHARSKNGRSKERFVYQVNEQKHTFQTYEAAYRSILKATKGEVCVVQRGIHLLTHKGRPFDIRLVVQRSPAGQWEVTGTLGRVAHPNKIVTNGSQGGTIYPTAYLLKGYTSEGRRKGLLKQMDQLGIATVKRLSRTHPRLLEIGLDLALDKALKPQILEVNTVPDACPFSLLSDQTMLRKIVRYGKAYGRTYNLNCKKAKRGL